MTLLWDAGHASVDTTLSMGGALATVTNNSGTQGGVRGTIGWATGKRYYEMDVANVDGFVGGLTTSDGSGFPGRSILGAGYSSEPSFSGLLTNFGSFSRVGAGGPNIVSPPKRIGIMADIDACTMQCISIDHPQGTDIYSMPGWAGGVVYPGMGQGFGASGSHTCAAIVYGDEAQFTLTRNAAYIAWSIGASSSSFFAVL